MEKTAKFTFSKLKIPDVILIEPNLFKDNRGFFAEVYNEKEFNSVGIEDEFIHEGASTSTKNVVRGLHFSKEPYEVAKLVRCTSGEIFDVAVDVRPDSPTFGEHVSEILSKENRKILYVPKGFAHGFCALSNEAEVSYKVSDYYRPEYDGGVVFDDVDISIEWPTEKPILSEKDKELPKLNDLSKK